MRIKLFNIGRAFVLTGIVELLLASLFFSYKKASLSIVLGDYSYFCFLVGTIVIVIYCAMSKVSTE